MTVTFNAGKMLLVIALVVTGLQAQPAVEYKVGTQPTGDVGITFGHIFDNDDKVKNVEVSCNGELLPSQCAIKARYPDGSVKHAIISCVLPQAKASTNQTLQLHFSSAQLSAAAVNVRDLVNNPHFDFKVSLATPLADTTISLRNLIQTENAPNQWLSGPVCSESIWSCKPDSVLLVFFYVRRYSTGEYRIGLAVENTWAQHRHNHDYSLTVMHGLTRTDTLIHESSVTHFRDGRWYREFQFASSSSDYQLKFDLAYLIACNAFPPLDTKLVITSSSSIDYGDTSLMGNGTVATYFPTTGGRPDIGILPAWTVRYLLTFDRRYRNQTWLNSRQAATAPIHFRDKATGDMWNIDDHPTSTLNASAANNSRPADRIPSATGTVLFSPDVSHHPSMNYTPYLFSGDRFYLEELFFWANYCLLSLNQSYRGNDSCLVFPDQTRAEAWAIRTICNAAFIAPDSCWEQAFFDRVLATNFSWYQQHSVGSHPLGIYDQLSTSERPEAYVSDQVKVLSSPWMDDYLIAALNLCIARGYQTARPMRNWLATCLIGRYTNAPDFNPYDGPAYRIARQSKDDRLYGSWAEVYSMTFANRTTPPPTKFVNISYAQGSRAALCGLIRDSIADADTAYAFIDSHIDKTLFKQSPTWAFVPLVDYIPIVVPDPIIPVDTGSHTQPGSKSKSFSILPSPFVATKGHTAITFAGSQIPRSKITIYDKALTEIVTIKESAGNSSIVWDVKDNRNRNVPTGVYLWILNPARGKSNRGKLAIVR